MLSRAKKTGQGYTMQFQTSSGLEGVCSVLLALAMQYCFHQVTAMKDADTIHNGKKLD